MTARRELLGTIIVDSGTIRIGDQGALRRHHTEGVVTACISNDGIYDVYYYPGTRSRIVIELAAGQEVWPPDQEHMALLAELDARAREGGRSTANEEGTPRNE